MADVASSLYDWNTNASSNSPSDSTTIGAGLADNLQQIQATTRAWLASKGADIASTGTMDIGAVAGLFHDITGNTTVTGLGTVSAGIWKVLQFDSHVPLVHSSALILPGAANITSAPGDVAQFASEGSGNWRCASYLRAASPPIQDASTAQKGIVELSTQAEHSAGTASRVPTSDLNDITLGTTSTATGGTEIGFTGIPAGVREITVSWMGLSGSGTSQMLVQLGISSGYETSGYEGVAGTRAGDVSSTAGFPMLGGTPGAASNYTGSMTLVMVDSASNSWVVKGGCSSVTGGTGVSMLGGSKSLAGVVDRVRITATNGTDTFDANGGVNISYRR